jgi:hypothetical protein
VPEWFKGPVLKCAQDRPALPRRILPSHVNQGLRVGAFLRLSLAVPPRPTPSGGNSGGSAMALLQLEDALDFIVRYLEARIHLSGRFRAYRNTTYTRPRSQERLHGHDAMINAAFYARGAVARVASGVAIILASIQDESPSS